MSRPAAPDAVAQQAIAWWVRLQSGCAAAAEHEACRAWLARDKAHQRAWDRVATLAAGIRRAPAAPALAILPDLASRGPSRRQALRLLAGLGVGAAAGAGAYSWTPWQRLVADASTGVGERRQIVPGPGVRLVLASDSAVRLRIDATQRAIALLRGEMLVDVHSGAAQPALQVDTGYGMALAEQARFGVCRAGGSARIGVYAGSVRVASAPHAPWHRGEAGESLRLDGAGVPRRGRVAADESAWEDGLLVVHGWRLDRLAAQLARYRLGVIRVDPAVAGLRLSGVFPLDDAERALAAARQSLPIEIRRHTAYWLSVTPRAA